MKSLIAFGAVLFLCLLSGCDEPPAKPAVDPALQALDRDPDVLRARAFLKQLHATQPQDRQSLIDQHQKDMDFIHSGKDRRLSMALNMIMQAGSERPGAKKTPPPPKKVVGSGGKGPGK